MQKLLFFLMPTCPHCKRAEGFLAELCEEDARYRAIPIERVDETRETERAEQYDYFYVPCFFLGDEKLHEGAVTKEAVRAVLDRALA